MEFINNRRVKTEANILTKELDKVGMLHRLEYDGMDIMYRLYMTLDDEVTMDAIERRFSHSSKAGREILEKWLITLRNIHESPEMYDVCTANAGYLENGTLVILPEKEIEL